MKKITVYPLFFVSFLLVNFLSSFNSYADDFEDLIRRAEQRRMAIAKTIEESTVFILVVQNDNLSFGSGFIIADNYIMTNAHVVEEYKEIYVAGKNFSYTQARIIKFDDRRGKDFAILKFNSPYDLPILKFSQDLSITDRISAWGYPLLVTKFDKSMDMILSGEFEKVPPLVYTEGTVSSFVDDGEIETIIHTANIAGGNSGGPLTNSRGEVVGINTWISQDEDEGAYVNASLTSRDMIAFIRSAGIEPQLADGNLNLHMAENNNNPSDLSNRLNNLNRNDNQSNNNNNYNSLANDIHELSGDLPQYFTAALDGDESAQAYIGSSYYTGKDAPENTDKAVYWLEQAASKGQNDSFSILGIIYLTDPNYKNVNKGLQYLNRAANNDPDYASTLAYFYTEGEIFGVKRNLDAALKAAIRGAKVNDPDALATLALLYYNGDVVSADHKKALQYATQAANQESDLAYAVLGMLYSSSHYIKEDENLAIKYTQMAADEGSAYGMGFLSFFYFQGYGVEKDTQAAFEYAEQAAELGNEFGQYVLGLCYVNGITVEKDEALGYAYLKMAAQKGASIEGHVEKIKRSLSSADIDRANEYIALWHQQWGLD